MTKALTDRAMNEEFREELDMFAGDARNILMTLFKYLSDSDRQILMDYVKKHNSKYVRLSDDDWALMMSDLNDKPF